MRAYTAFFGFKFEPFERAVNLDLFYLSEQHKNALAMLETFLTSEGSLALLLGESGVGKSLTIKKFLSQLPSGVCYTYINLPNFTEGDLLKKLLADFVDAPINDDHPREQFARFLAQIDRGALIIAVDGAHTLSSQSLLTLLALKENGVKIILSGLASLRERVELQGAIDAEFEIPTLSFASCKEYLSYRVKQAGSTLELPNPLAKQIWLVSKGNPLIINALMKRLFAAAFLDNSLSLKERYFTRAALSLNLAGKVERKNPFFYAAVAATVAAISLMGADFFLFKAAKKTSPQTSAELPQENPSISDLNPFERAEGFSDGAEVYAFVEAAVLNVRTAPELSSQKLAVLKSGERVLILEQQPEWAKVVLENGQVGWVFKPYISFEPKN